MLSKLSEEFDERNCKLLAIGVDTKLGHKAFIKEIQVPNHLLKTTVDGNVKNV